MPTVGAKEQQTRGSLRHLFLCSALALNRKRPLCILFYPHWTKFGL
jgi:hypothetical protein